MLKKVEHRFGNFPLYGPQDAPHIVLFPRGKSDKFYLYAPDGVGWWGIPGYKEQLLCFKSRGNDVKLAYSVKLKRVNFKPPKHNIAVRSMLDYISTLGYGSHRDRSLNGSEPTTYSLAVSGYVRRDVKRDLSLEQELVGYEHNHVINRLYVECLSSNVASEDQCGQRFEIPGESGSASAKRWYATYGLPVADCELTAKSKRTGKQK